MSGTFSTPETLCCHSSEEPAGVRDAPPPRRPTQTPARAAKLALVALGLALGIAVGELLARAIGFEFRPHLRNRVYFAEPDPLLGWRNRRGMSGPYGGDEFLTWVTHNEDGQRGRRHARERTPGAVRIAVLGDSQAWGDGVADDEIFVELLSRDGVELLNFACPGYGTDQQLLVLDNLAARWAPDVVLIAAYVGNDLKDNLSAGTWQYPKPYFELTPTGALELRGVPVPTSELVHLGVELYRAAMRHSALLNAIAVVTAEAPPDEAASRPTELRVYRSLYTREPAERDRHGLEMTARLLVETARHARAIGARPVVLVLPEPWQVEVANNPAWRRALRVSGADWRLPQHALARALGAEGVEVIDPLPALARVSRRNAGATPAFYRRWRHLTAHGHRAVARHLAPRLGPHSAARAPAGNGIVARRAAE